MDGQSLTTAMVNKRKGQARQRRRRLQQKREQWGRGRGSQGKSSLRSPFLKKGVGTKKSYKKGGEPCPKKRALGGGRGGGSWVAIVSEEETHARKLEQRD